MNSANLSITSKRKDRPKLLVLCLLFSLLLHLLLVALIAQQNRDTEDLSLAEKSTIVHLVDKSRNNKQQYELDQQPPQITTEQPPKSSRLAEQQQRVKMETAPKGDDVRDQTIAASPKQRASAGQQRSAPAPTKQVQNRSIAPPESATKANPKRSEDGQFPAQPQVNHAKPQPNERPPTLEQLTQLTPSTLSRIASNNQAAVNRVKQRDDVDEGDTVWLNLERGTLISFFRRFRNQIEGVWNYPRAAVENEMQGILLLKITIDRTGELLDVDLLQSSGFELLDYEAIQAVYRAAPFGPLGKHYPHPDLKIMANFRYMISGKYIYGQQR